METQIQTEHFTNTLYMMLEETFDNRIKQLIHDIPEWQNEQQIGGIIAVIVHTAYHLGEIRQALCTLKA